MHFNCRILRQFVRFLLFYFWQLLWRERLLKFWTACVSTWWYIIIFFLDESSYRIIIIIAQAFFCNKLNILIWVRTLQWLKFVRSLNHSYFSFFNQIFFNVQMPVCYLLLCLYFQYRLYWSLLPGRPWFYFHGDKLISVLY